MAQPTLIGGISSQRGVNAAEAGIAVESIESTFSNPIQELLDQWGGPVGYAVSFDARYDMTITGEITDDSVGVVASTWHDAFTPNAANIESSAFTRETTGTDWNDAFFLRDASISAAREQWKTATATYQMMVGVSGS